MTKLSSVVADRASQFSSFDRLSVNYGSTLESVVVRLAEELFPVEPDSSVATPQQCATSGSNDRPFSKLGNCLASSAPVQPPHRMQKMPLTTSRRFTRRGRPPVFAKGMSGDRIAYCLSVRSVRYSFRFMAPVVFQHTGVKFYTFQTSSHSIHSKY